MKKIMFAALCAMCASALAQAQDDGWTWYENETLPLGGKGFKDTATTFERWPTAAKDKLPRPLVSMGSHTTGMYLRFTTDSSMIRIEWKVHGEHPRDPLIPEAGLIGIDVYGWDKSADGGKGAWRFQGNKRYWGRDKANPGVAQFGWTPGRPCLVFLPLRATMKSFRIGVAKGKTIKPHPYRVPDAKPIVHYGTSIVHGGCASRPGLAFTAVAARELDLPYVNLGFSGAAKMEASVPDVLAAADASLYVIDARWNMSPEMVATNCVPFLRRMKELKPDVPLLLCEGCTVNDGDRCNAAFRKAYDLLRAEDPVKWRNLYYFTEKTMLPKDDKEATHDFCHPNDYGMMHMGRAYARRIRDVLDAEAQPRTDALVVDFDSPVGPVKPVNGVGQPPTVGWNDFHLFKLLKDAGIPYSRLHDTGGALGKNLYVDIPNLFRDFDADENDPASYDFTFTDGLMKALVANGVAPYFRLGITIENAVTTKAYRVFPPKDYAKWARVCEHVIRHYNEGWANGFKMNVRRWEIWNEPENHPEPEKNPMWRGDWNSYVELYRVAARHLKAKFPHLEIGGYGSCGFYAVDGVGKTAIGANASPRNMYFVECFTNFIDIVKREGLPLNFFSMHTYAHPRNAKVQVKWARARLDEAGLAHVPISLNEWLPEPSIQRLGTPRQSALIAAQLANFQNGPVADAEIYDARCGLGAYSPLFDGIKRIPYRAYYVYVAFNVLRKLGTAVRAEGSADFLGDRDGLWAIAATDSKGYGALIVANPTDRAFRMPSAFGRWRITRQRAIDADRKLGDLAPDGTICADTVLLVEVAPARPYASDPCDHKKTVQRRVEPASVTTNAAGNVLVDFGREAFGFLELLPPPGSPGEYDVRLGELLKGDGVDMKPGATIRAARVKGRIAAGGGVHRVPLVPDKRNTAGGREGAAIQIPAEHGVIMPFRYAEFAAAPFPVTKDRVRMVAVNYPMDMAASSFECDDPNLVKVYDFCKHSILATSFAGLYVDGDRERIPYEMDAYLNQLCEYAVHADYSLARASHEYLMAHPTWPTEWKQYSVRMAWTDWMWSGDARSIAKFYDQLKGEKLLASHARADGLLVSGGERPRNSLKNACGLADIVDWPNGERDGFVFRDVNAVVNAFHYRNLLEMADIARALGKGTDADMFAERAKKVHASYQKVFFDPARGVYRDGEGTDHAAYHSNAAALAMGLVPPERRAKVADYCLSRGMACSPGFAQYLLEGLFALGRADDAIRLMTSSGDRSWLGMMDFGATVSMEAWAVKYKPNLDLNHAWGAVPINIISRFVAGVEPLEPGFRKISIRPQIGSLGHVKAKVPTAAGVVMVDVTPDRLVFVTPAPAEVTFAGRTAAFQPGCHVIAACGSGGDVVSLKPCRARQ